MKKHIIGVFLVLALIVVGTGTVLAAPQQLVNVTNFNLKSGSAFTATALQAKYNQAEIDFTINSVTSGTQKNAIEISRYDGSKYVLKISETISITPYVCIKENLGYVGYGNWAYSDIAGNWKTGETYAGWAGINKLNSI